MNRDKVESFLVIPLLCFLGLSLCWSTAHSKWSESSDIAELESEFSKVLPPSNAKQGDVSRIDDLALQVVVADYATDVIAKDLERYYDSALKKNGWVERAATLGSDQRVSLYCKGTLDAILDKESAPGRYFFGVRRQQGSSFKTGCEQQVS